VGAAERRARRGGAPRGGGGAPLRGVERRVQGRRGHLERHQLHSVSDADEEARARRRRRRVGRRVAGDAGDAGDACGAGAAPRVRPARLRPGDRRVQRPHSARRSRRHARGRLEHPLRARRRARVRLRQHVEPVPQGCDRPRRRGTAREVHLRDRERLRRPGSCARAAPAAPRGRRLPEAPVDEDPPRDARQGRPPRAPASLFLSLFEGARRRAGYDGSPARRTRSFSDYFAKYGTPSSDSEDDSDCPKDSAEA